MKIDNDFIHFDFKFVALILLKASTQNHISRQYKSVELKISLQLLKVTLLNFTLICFLFKYKVISLPNSRFSGKVGKK